MKLPTPKLIALGILQDLLIQFLKTENVNSRHPIVTVMSDGLSPFAAYVVQQSAQLVDVPQHTVMAEKCGESVAKYVQSVFFEGKGTDEALGLREMVAAAAWGTLPWVGQVDGSNSLLAKQAQYVDDVQLFFCGHELLFGTRVENAIRQDPGLKSSEITRYTMQFTLVPR